MKIEELRRLIAEIRSGRPEDAVLDWKRSFWRLEVDESRREFLKDVTAMANSIAPEGTRRILIGVSKNGRFQDTQLPYNEADLQQHLAAITPVPNVKFQTLWLEGKRIVIIEISPPFDRPYVAKVASDYFVWVRQGSSTSTASRYLLDQFYTERERPAPMLAVSWLDDQSQPIDVLLVKPLPELEINEEMQRLANARPSEEDLALVDEQKEAIEKLIRAVGPEKLGLGRTRAKPESIVKRPLSLAKNVDTLLKLAAEAPGEFIWRVSLIERVLEPKFEIYNGGTSPANNLVIYIKSSPQIHFLSWSQLNELAISITEKRIKDAHKVIELARNLDKVSVIRYSIPPGYDYYRQFDLLERSSALIPPFPRVVEVSLEDRDIRIDIKGSLRHNFRREVEAKMISLCARIGLDEEASVEYECHADNLPVPSRGNLRLVGMKNRGET